VTPDYSGAGLIAVVPLAMVLTELGLRLPFAAPRQKMQLMLSKSLRTMRAAAVSDHWRQRALLFYSRITFRAALTLLGNVAVLGAAAAVGVLSVGLVVPGFDAATFSVPGTLLVFLTAALYLPLRLKHRHG
jgi:hypothetical protein